LEKKEDMRRRGVPSPDGWDAVVLTFAEPVAPVYAAPQLSFTTQFSRDPIASRTDIFGG
jgi:hypothetical protein